MSKKSTKIAALIGNGSGSTMDPHYAGFFACFNRQQFFEAHEVLEELWLEDRHGASGAFYKGLIQLAGAFVHLQKSRPGPAAALFRLAATNLNVYRPRYERLDVEGVLNLISAWLGKLAAPRVGALMPEEFPTIELVVP